MAKNKAVFTIKWLQSLCMYSWCKYSRHHRTQRYHLNKPFLEHFIWDFSQFRGIPNSTVVTCILQLTLYSVLGYFWTQRVYLLYHVDNGMPMMNWNFFYLMPWGPKVPHISVYRFFCHPLNRVNCRIRLGKVCHNYGTQNTTVYHEIGKRLLSNAASPMATKTGLKWQVEVWRSLQPTQISKEQFHATKIAVPLL